MENKTLQHTNKDIMLMLNQQKPKSLIGNRKDFLSLYYTLYTVVKKGVQSVKLGYAAVS